MSRGRNFVFTLNNYTHEQEESIKNLCNNKVTFVAYSHEIAPTTGTPHLQGYLHHNEKINFSNIRKWYPWHIEIMRGSLHDNEVYCSKQDTLLKFGTEPVSAKAAAKLGAKERWDLAKAGRHEELDPEHIKIYEYIFAKYGKKPESRPTLDNIFISGPSGCGKSKWAHETFPGHYKKSWNQWWDGYMGEDVIILDDMSPRHTEFLQDRLKNWLDHYPFKADVKGGMMLIRPKTIIITSQYSLSELFPEEKSVEAMNRRFQYRMYYNPVYKCLAYQPLYNRDADSLRTDTPPAQIQDSAWDDISNEELVSLLNDV